MATSLRQEPRRRHHQPNTSNEQPTGKPLITDILKQVIYMSIADNQTCATDTGQITAEILCVAWGLDGHEVLK